MTDTAALVAAALAAQADVDAALAAAERARIVRDEAIEGLHFDAGLSPAKITAALGNQTGLSTSNVRNILRVASTNRRRAVVRL